MPTLTISCHIYASMCVWSTDSQMSFKTKFHRYFFLDFPALVIRHTLHSTRGYSWRKPTVRHTWWPWVGIRTLPDSCQQHHLHRELTMSVFNRWVWQHRCIGRIAIHKEILFMGIQLWIQLGRILFHVMTTFVWHLKMLVQNLRLRFLYPKSSYLILNECTWKLHLILRE